MYKKRPSHPPQMDSHPITGPLPEAYIQYIYIFTNFNKNNLFF